MEHHNKEQEHRGPEVYNEPREEVVVNIDAKEGGKNQYLLPGSILIAALLISGSIIYLVGNKNSLPKLQAGDQGQNPGAAAPAGTLPDIGGRDVILGDANAPVTLIEYGDYQCPFCARFFETVEPQLRANYVKTGKAKMIFRGFEFLGPESLAAGEAAECAKDQSKFWAYHDALYTAEAQDGHENSGNLTRTLFLSLAQQVSMDTAAFASCLDSHKYSTQVQQDVAAAANAGVNSTPTLFVNGTKLVGALPYVQYAQAIDALLKGK